jgi:hypothetical protein
VRWVGLLASAQDNLRTVLASAAETGHVDDGLRIASAIWQFWWMRGQFQEGRLWLDELLARPDRVNSSLSVRAKALSAAASLALATGDYSRARERCEQAVSAASAAGDRARLASGLHHLGSLAAQEGDAARAITCVEASLTHARAVGASDVLAVGLRNPRRSGAPTRRPHASVGASGAESGLAACARQLALGAVGLATHGRGCRLDSRKMAPGQGSLTHE